VRSPQRALIILDMINTFDFPGGAVLCRRALSVAPAIAKLKDKVKRSGGHCLYVNDNFSQWQSDFRELVAKAEAGPGRPIVERLKPRDDDSFVLKPKHSAFFQTPLRLLLEKLEARALILTGIAADACVLATALDAHMHEFEVWAPSDCIAAMSDARKRAALMVLKHSSIETRSSTSNRVRR
jgi:nicotinamidase-related amidase